MKLSELTELMHAVLDGEATPGETRELDRLVAADPAARAKFDELRRLFDGLAGVPMAFPPEGLVAAVMAAVPQNAMRRGRLGQLFLPSRVITDKSSEIRAEGPGTSAAVQRVSQSGPFSRGKNMSEQTSGSFDKRKILIGAGIAAAAAAVVAVMFGTDLSSSGKDAAGTIMPAQRHVAPQPTSDDIKLGGQAAPQTGQTNPAGSNAGGSNAGGSNAGGSNAGGSNAGGSNAGGSAAGGSN